jgi:hypothetical protein
MTGGGYPFGTDYRLVFDAEGQPDLDTTFAVETNPAKILLWDLYKIVTTAAGTLWWAPTATEDVTQARNDAMSPARRTALGARLQAAIEQDGRYSQVTVSVDFVAGTRTLVVSIAAVASSLPLNLVLVNNDDGTITVQEMSASGNVQ